MRWPKQRLVPSFRTGVLLSVCVWLCFAAWLFLDDWFDSRVTQAMWLIGIVPVYDLAFSVVEDTPRRIFLIALTLMALISLLIVAFRLACGSPRDRSLRTWGVATALVCLWLLFLASHQHLAEAGFCWRVRRALPGLKQDAAVLAAQWPSADGTLPSLGEFFVASRDPMYLGTKWYSELPFDEPPGSPITVAVPTYIYKAEDGALHFFMFTQSRFRELEYRGDDTEPRPFVFYATGPGLNRVAMTNRPVDFIEIEPHWFLTQYESDYADRPGN